MKNKKLTRTIFISILIIIFLFSIKEIFFSEEYTDYSDMIGLNFPNSFDEYISPYGEFNDDEIYDEYKEKYNQLLIEINKDSYTEETQHKYIEEFNKPLRQIGFPLPYISFSEYLNSIDNLNTDDKIHLINLYNKYLQENDDYTKYENEIANILRNYDLNGFEILDQLSNYNYKFAIFSLDNNQFKLDNTFKTNQANISKEKETFYNTIINNILLITPKSIVNKINTIEFCTDGRDRTLAYVIQNPDYTKFRLSIDEKDAVDELGNFTNEGLETLIHEFAHIITLNNSQVNISEMEKEDPDINKSYKESSYLNSFYNLYWKNIYPDFIEENNIDFYKKYKNQFVSDYAATNIEEDIAESFRAYVFDIKIKKDSIASNKVMFFNKYPQMVELKNHFKKYI